MGIKTGIQWADSTLNVMIGCKGCELYPEHCYARAWVDRFAGRTQPGHQKAYPDSFEEPELFLRRLDAALKWSDLSGRDRPDKPWLNGMPRVIFLNDLGDTFTPGMDWSWFGPVCDRIEQSPHIWVVLTKWPRRFRDFSEWYIGTRSDLMATAELPNNLWGGVSVTDQPTADARIRELVDIPLTKRLVSAEPLLGLIEVPTLTCSPVVAEYNLARYGRSQPIDGVFTGGESGSNARKCNVAWIQSIVGQCQEAGVPVFVKQLGARPVESRWSSGQLTGPAKVSDYPVQPKDPKGGDWSEWEEDIRVRELPRV